MTYQLQYTNLCGVGGDGRIMLPGRPAMSAIEALELAAFLVVLSDIAAAHKGIALPSFEEVLATVRNT